MTLAPELVVPHVQLAGPLLGSLQRAVGQLTGALAIEQLAEAVADAGVSGLDARVAVVAVPGEDGHNLRAAHARGLSSEARQRITAVPADGPSLIAKVARSGRPVLVHSVAETAFPASQDAPTPLIGGALAGLPIVREGRGLGALVFGWPRPRTFSDEDRAFLDVLTGLCALALGQLRLSTERDRVRALLRRSELTGRPARAHVRVGDMHIDVVGHRILTGDRAIRLTPTELALLLFLADEPGRARSRREILRHLWHTEHVGGERACDAHVSNLRHKIERDPARPERVVTHRGVGYALQVH